MATNGENLTSGSKKTKAVIDAERWYGFDLANRSGYVGRKRPKRRY